MSVNVIHGSRAVDISLIVDRGFNVAGQQVTQQEI